MALFCQRIMLNATSSCRFHWPRPKRFWMPKKLMAEGPVLTIENGDWLQGSPLAYYAAKMNRKPEQLTQIYNAVGYDAGIIGNHEFNYGSDYLRQALATL